MITEKDIRKLLTDLNKNKAVGYLVTRPLSDTVEYAKVWPEASLSGAGEVQSNGIPFTYYFIRGKEGKYAAAVTLFDHDLKWAVLPEYRKSNLLFNALRETILPHILQHKPVQRMMLNQAEYGIKEFAFVKKTALAAGFKITREENGILKLVIEAASLGKQGYIAGKNTGITEKRMLKIKNELALYIQKLRIFETEITMKTGNIEYAEDVKEIIDRLNRLVNWNME
jgi:hypothetical protein